MGVGDLEGVLEGDLEGDLEEDLEEGDLVEGLLNLANCSRRCWARCRSSYDLVLTIFFVLDDD